MTNADRARRFRQRRNRGKAVWRIEVSENDLADAMIAAGLVPDDCADRAIYERAAAEILRHFSANISVTRYAALIRSGGKQ